VKLFNKLWDKSLWFRDIIYLIPVAASVLVGLKFFNFDFRAMLSIFVLLLPLILIVVIVSEFFRDSE